LYPHLKNLPCILSFFRDSILFSWLQQKENAMQQPQQQQKTANPRRRQISYRTESRHSGSEI
jgi:hypothetical protein